jgi:hypothetical protein
LPTGIDNTQEHLIIIPPDAAFASAHELMAERDLVFRPLHGGQELRDSFLGHADFSNLIAPESSNKVAFGIATEAHLRSVIYTNLVELAHKSNGAIDFRDLPGSVPTIIERKPDMVGNCGNVNAILFYGITNVSTRDEDPGSGHAGRRLIQGLYPTLNNLPLIRPTVSPTTGSAEAIRQEAGDSASEQDMIDISLARLISGADPVSKFHLPNGAFVANCQVVDAGEGERNVYNGKRVMINYLYPAPNLLASFQQHYADQRTVVMTETLARHLPTSARTNIIPVLATEVFPRAVDQGLQLVNGAVVPRGETRNGRRGGNSLDTSEEWRPILSN